MSHRINICDLTLGQLNGACLTKISQFTSTLEQVEGTVLELKDKNVVGKVVKFAKTTSNAQLKSLYYEIKDEIKRHINSPGFEKHRHKFGEPATKSGARNDHVYRASINADA